MGFHTVWLVYLGRRYGIVQSLSEKADTPRHLAKSLRLQGRAVETWCEAAAALGVSGTPTFFINGIALVGAQPLAQFRSVIDGELPP